MSDAETDSRKADPDAARAGGRAPPTTPASDAPAPAKPAPLAKADLADPPMLCRRAGACGRPASSGSSPHS